LASVNGGEGGLHTWLTNQTSQEVWDSGRRGYDGCSSGLGRGTCIRGDCRSRGVRLEERHERSVLRVHALGGFQVAAAADETVAVRKPLTGRTERAVQVALGKPLGNEVGRVCCTIVVRCASDFVSINDLARGVESSTDLASVVSHSLRDG